MPSPFVTLRGEARRQESGAEAGAARALLWVASPVAKPNANPGPFSIAERPELPPPAGTNLALAWKEPATRARETEQAEPGFPGTAWRSGAGKNQP